MVSYLFYLATMRIALYSSLEVLSYRNINEHWKVVIHGTSMAKECL